MLDYNEYHDRTRHAKHCDDGHDYTWLVEPLTRQLSDLRSLVGYEDHLYLAGLINHMAERIDAKDVMITEGLDALREAEALLIEIETKRLKRQVIWRGYARVAVTVITLTTLFAGLSWFIS